MSAIEVECGFLTYHPPMPNFPNIVRYKGHWMPEALITRGDHKRFSEAELAAEYHANEIEAWRMSARRPEFYDLDQAERLEAQEWTLRRFASHQHFDEE